MKKSLLILGFMVLCGSLSSQEPANSKNSLRIGFNGAFFGSGDIIGPCIYGEYTFKLNDHFSLAPKVSLAKAGEFYENYYGHVSSFATSLSLRITPLAKLLHRLNFDLGALYHNFTDTYGHIDLLEEYGQYFSSITHYYVENLFGLFLSANFNIIESEKIISGLRFDLYTSFTDGYYNCDSVQTGLFFGINF